MNAINTEIVEKCIDSELQCMHEALNSIDLKEVDGRMFYIMARAAIGACVVKVYGGTVEDIEMEFDMTRIQNGMPGCLMFIKPQYAEPVMRIFSIIEDDLRYAATSINDNKIMRARRLIERVEERVGNAFYEQQPKV